MRDDLTRTTHEPRPAGDLREANDRLIEAADYLIDRYQAMSRGKVVRDLAEAEAGYDVAKDMMSLALATHSPAPMAGEGWQDIATLTEADGYVVGWAERSDGCTDREHFIGRKYDIRTNAIINEWTGRWRVVSHWQALTRPAAAHPSTQEG